MKQGAAAVAQVPRLLWAPFKAFGHKSMELSAFMHRKDVSDVRHAPYPYILNGPQTLATLTAASVSWFQEGSVRTCIVC